MPCPVKVVPLWLNVSRDFETTSENLQRLKGVVLSLVELGLQHPSAVFLTPEDRQWLAAMLDEDPQVEEVFHEYR